MVAAWQVKINEKEKAMREITETVESLLFVETIVCKQIQGTRMTRMRGIYTDFSDKPGSYPRKRNN